MTLAWLLALHFHHSRAITRPGQHCRAQVHSVFRQQFCPSWNLIDASGTARLPRQSLATALRGRLATLPGDRAALQCP